MEATLHYPFPLLSLWMLHESFLDNSFRKEDAVIIKDNIVELWLYFRSYNLFFHLLFPLKVLLKLKYYKPKVVFSLTAQCPPVLMP